MGLDLKGGGGGVKIFRKLLIFWKTYEIKRKKLLFYL